MKQLITDSIFMVFLFSIAIGVLILLICFSPYKQFLAKPQPTIERPKEIWYVDIRNKA